MGMVINRKTWNSIFACKDIFCTFDDYNWDWSLNHVSQTCLPRKLKVIVPQAPRVFHIGKCGIHHIKKGCNASTTIRDINSINANAKLYPDMMMLTTPSISLKPTIFRGNGGWSDKRDQALCIYMAQPDAMAFI